MSLPPGLSALAGLARGTVLLALILAFGAGLHLHRKAHEPVLDAGRKVEVTIERGAAYGQVVRLLRDAGLRLEQPYLWLFSEWLGADTRVKAGSYLLLGPLGMLDVLHQIIGGYGRVQLRQALLEGWTIAEMMRSMAASRVIAPVDEPWRELGYASREEMEGWCMPDTYYYERGDTMVDIFEVCVQTMQRTLDELWPARSAGLPYRNKREALILASIVEAETNLDRERDVVAGVLVTRLRKNIRLQADPTVIYGLGDAFDNNLKRSHLRQSPSVNRYNTYQMHGLPPGPISNPGRKSLLAALHPNESGEYLFYVSKGDGSHYFSRTYKEHKAAVRKYQLRR